MKDEVLTDAIEIKATPENVFDFLCSLVDDDSYRSWHPDHVSMHWRSGTPWHEDSVAHIEECLHGKLHRLTFMVTSVVPNRKIEYVPASWLLRRYIPNLAFYIEPKGESCVFRAVAHFRLSLLPRLLAKRRIEQGLLIIRNHLKEEGENLKNILEAENARKQIGHPQK